MIGILGHPEKPTSFKDDILLVTYTVMLGSSWIADIPPVPDLVVHRKDDVLLVTDIVALEYWFITENDIPLPRLAPASQRKDDVLLVTCIVALGILDDNGK